jgi:hypothetical protein
MAWSVYDVADMIDWWSGLTNFDAEGLRCGCVYKIDHNGLQEWNKTTWREVEGSYSSKIQVRRLENEYGVWLPGGENGVKNLPHYPMQISGNITKFLQGHNVFGPDVEFYLPMLRETVRRFPVGIRPPDVDKSDLDVASVRMDLTKMFDLGSHQNVHDWLSHVGSASSCRHKSGIIRRGRTVYFGMHSKVWSGKAYCKVCELMQPGQSLPDKNLNELLVEFAQPLLRIEFVLRRPEIKKWSALGEDVFWHYFERINVGVIDMSVKRDISNLPKGAQLCFRQWYEGGDVRAMYSVRTFYRYRKFIFEELKIDISCAATEQDTKLEHIKFDGQYLRDHEIKTIPEALQGLLFKPELARA